MAPLHEPSTRASSDDPCSYDVGIGTRNMKDHPSSFQIYPTPFLSSGTTGNPNSEPLPTPHPPSSFPLVLASFQPFPLGSLEWAWSG